MMEFRLDDIEHADIVISHFGYWPSFQGAEILSMTFVRDKGDGQAVMEMKILAFEATDKLKDASLELTKHCLIDIQFIGLEENKINGFSQKNILDGLHFGKRDVFLFCEFNGAHGVSGHIHAKAIRIHKLTLSIGPNP